MLKQAVEGVLVYVDDHYYITMIGSDKILWNKKYYRIIPELEQYKPMISGGNK